MKLGTYNYGTYEAFDTHGVPLGQFSDYREAEKAMWAARLSPTFFRPEEVPAIPLLLELIDWAIKQNERRLPKWNFSFAADLAVQIQPRVTRAQAFLFEGYALQIEDVSVTFFTEPIRLRDRAHWRIKFKLFAADHDAANWTLKPTLAARGRLCPANGLLKPSVASSLLE
jgi:hypothetical protein